MAWHVIGETRARRHYLFGFGGWLIVWPVVFAADLALGFLRLPRAWRSLDDFATISAPAVPIVYKTLLVLCGPAIQIALLVCWFFRFRSFRTLFPIMLLFCVVAFALFFLGLTEFYRVAHPPTYQNLVRVLPSVLAQFLAGLTYVTILSLYLFKSRRFRVTFESKVRGDDLAYLRPE